MTNVIQFKPRTPGDSKPIRPKDQGPVATLVISDSVFSIPSSEFPFPAAPAVCPKYLKALEEQKAKTHGK